MPIAVRFEIRKLLLLNGSCPFDEWFDKLDADDQYTVETRLLRVRLGSFGEINSVGDGVYELKFRKGRALRVYYGQMGRHQEGENPFCVAERWRTERCQALSMRKLT